MDTQPDRKTFTHYHMGATTGISRKHGMDGMEKILIQTQQQGWQTPIKIRQMDATNPNSKIPGLHITR
jgi:hypothetical protein